MILEEKIKKIREKEDLSQEAFAERLGVSRQTVINWEKGKSTPTFELLMLIANEFHIEINSLVQTDMEPQYLTLEEQVNKQESILNKEIKPSFDSKEKPLYIPKKAFFTGDVKYNFLMMLVFIFTDGMEIWIFSDMDDWHWKWLILIFIIGFSIASLYNFINFIIAVITRKKAKCYLYQDHYYLEKGLKEKESKTSAIYYYNNMKIYQTLMGKILNYGDVVIYFQPTTLTIIGCKKPYKLKKFIQKTYPSKEDFTE